LSTYLYIELTEQQASALASLAEMTQDLAPLTFADWAEWNPRSMPAVARALDRLNYALTDAAVMRRDRKR
jgi:hypothetical protein